MYKNILASVAIANLFGIEPTLANERNLYWGDTHLHTENSVDAFEAGNSNADLDTAYRFARGFPVLHPRTGHRIQITRPLDFLVVADHASLLSLQRMIQDKDSTVLSTPVGKELADLYEDDPYAIFRKVLGLSMKRENQELREQLHVPEVIKSAWQYQVDKATEYNAPGEFTAFIGWEWTSNANSKGLHRVVFTSGAAEQVRDILPLSNLDTVVPEELWQYLEETEKSTGAEFIAIPHNSNVSRGSMFPLVQMDGSPIDIDYAKTRMRWEPVIEITQTKGTSETHPFLSQKDEYANFEIRDTLLSGKPAAAEIGSFARPALLRGLEQEKDIGANPYQFGFIGSTDSHSGLSSVEENNFYGKTGKDLLPGERLKNELGYNEMSAWEVSAGGLAAVWADENSRESIFSAFKRKEVYATTGPRIQLRVFGGFNFSNRDVRSKDLAKIGYKKGVPMGGTLIGSRKTSRMSLLIDAVKDPIEANLERIQVIKGWLDSEGVKHEKIFDVAVSGKDQKSYNNKKSTLTHSGSQRFTLAWTDPEFNPKHSAFYYVRAIQVPTPRHHTFDLVALKMDPDSFSEPSMIQERAYSSPIWFQPK